MNSIHEKENAISRAGSFYYKNLSEEGAKTARRLTHLSWLTRIFFQFRNAGYSVLSGGYFQDCNKVIKFDDSNIDYYGFKNALQERERTLPLKLKNYTALAEENDRALSELDRDANINQVLAFPFEGEDIVLGDKPIQYGLYIDDDVRVTSIAKKDGTVLLDGVDFKSYYGLILLPVSPAKLFPEFKFLARSYVYRSPNILSYTFGVGKVYGPIDRIVAYYRVTQSPKAFYLAAAQAAGFAVVREGCKVLSVEPLDKGCSYRTTDGRYDAPYSHRRYKIGDSLQKNTVIGGEELFNVILPTENIRPDNLGAINLDKLLPVHSLYAADANIEVATVEVDGTNVLFPKFSGSAYQLNKYFKFIADSNGIDIPTDGYETMNAIDLVRNNLAKDRAIILRINRSRMHKEMQMRLDAFVEREAPVGAIIFKENMIKEDF